VALTDETRNAESPSGEVLPTIFVDRDFHVVLDYALRALASEPPRFRGDALRQPAARQRAAP
jgi:hypothetical protein